MHTLRMPSCILLVGGLSISDTDRRSVGYEDSVSSWRARYLEGRETRGDEGDAEYLRDGVEFVDIRIT